MGLVAKAFQDIITFSRASANATYVNSNGYITTAGVYNYLTYSNQPENAAWTKSNSFVQQNLLTYSEDFTNVNWVTTNVAAPTANTTIAPDGTLTADTLTASAGAGIHNVNQNTAVSLTPVTLSIYLKAGTYGFVQLFHGANSAYYANFNLSTGVLGTVGGSASATITAAPNGFYRCTLTITPSAASAFRVAFISSATAVYNENWTAAGTETFYAWGAQLVQGSVPGDYRATTSAALPCLYADYNGALRARKLCEDANTSSHMIIESAGTIGAVETYSVFAKAGERNWIALQMGGGSAAYFNLATGVLGTVVSATATITSVGNGYYRCTMTATRTGSTQNYIYATFADSVVSYAGNGSSGIYIADAQLNDGSSALAYYDTTASAYNAPRFDYDPVTLAAKGLLVEEQRANLLTYSNDFSNAVWSKANITLTAGATLGPDGTFSMTKLEATASAATTCRQVLLATSTSHTFSVYVKQGSGATQANLFAVYNNTTASDVAVISFNYSTGVVTQTVGTGATATNVGNGIWRIVMPVTSGLTAGNSIAVYTGFSGAVETAGEFAYFSATQVEAGAFATSYIPTTTSQLTRAADVASVNTLSPWYNSAAGTWFAEFQTSWSGLADSSRWVVGADQSANKRMLYISSATDVIATYDGASTLSPTGDVTGAIAKAASTYNATTRAIVANGGTVASGAIAAGFAASTAINIGLGSFANSQPCGWIRRVTFYPRVLTNAELQTLTTL